MPLYLISTRDSFAFDLIEKKTTLIYDQREITKIEYFFDPKNYPDNYPAILTMFPDYRVGVTLY